MNTAEGHSIDNCEKKAVVDSRTTCEDHVAWITCRIATSQPSILSSYDYFGTARAENQVIASVPIVDHGKPFMNPGTGVQNTGSEVDNDTLGMPWNDIKDWDPDEYLQIRCGAPLRQQSTAKYSL